MRISKGIAAATVVGFLVGNILVPIPATASGNVTSRVGECSSARSRHLGRSATPAQRLQLVKTRMMCLLSGARPQALQHIATKMQLRKMVAYSESSVSARSKDRLLGGSTAQHSLVGSVAPAASAVVSMGHSNTHITCDDADKRMEAKDYSDGNEQLEVGLRQLSCTLKTYNETAASANEMAASGRNFHYPLELIYLTNDPSRIGEIVFGGVTVEDAKRANTVCKMLGAGFLAAQVPDPDLIALADGTAKYSCDSYYDAVVKDDPLLITFPTLIPGAKITRDVIAVTQASAQILAHHYRDHPSEVVGLTYEVQGLILEKVADKLPGPTGVVAKFIARGLKNTANGTGKVTHVICQAALFGQCPFH